TEEHCALSAGHSKTVVPRAAALLGSRRAGGGRTGAVGGPHRVIRSSSATSWRSAGINKVAGGRPYPHDDTHGCATGGTAGCERLWGCALRRPALAGGALHDQQANSRERDGTAGMEQAEVADFHEALGQDVLEEPAEELQAIELGGAETGTAHFPVGERD